MINAQEINQSQIRKSREFVFSQSDFDLVRKLIYQRAGISLSDQKKEMVYSRLARRLRALDMDSFKDYLGLLNSPSASEWQAFTNALTTNLTAFFRESHHFPILADHLKKIVQIREPTIWCCASSTGEEPYSIAMTAVESLGNQASKVKILATDVDTQVLATARSASYDKTRVSSLSEMQLKQFFLRGQGSNQGKVRVREQLRDMITFQPLNLLDPSWDISGPFDVIFCRNVMIYFDRPTQYKILSRFVPLMHRDAILFAGHSESLFHASDLFRLRGKTVYQLARS